METSGKILIVGGGVLAVVVAALVSILLAQRTVTTTILPNQWVNAATLQETTPVIVATGYIPAGTTISASDVRRLFKMVYEPKGAVATQTVFVDPAQLEALLSVAPRKTTAPIAAGEQLSSPLLSGMAVPGQGGAVAARLSRGLDAETVRVPVADKAVDGAIAVNDRVDLIYSRPLTSTNVAGSDGGGLYTAIFIEGATVVATDALSSTYTLALTPGDAIRLAHVKDAGWSVHLILRSVFDGDQARRPAAVSGADVAQ